MATKKHIIIMIILGCLVSIVILHLYASFFLPKYYGISTSDIVLIITAGFVFWYAWETRKIHKEQTARFISVFFQEYNPPRGTGRDRFLVKNDGKGTGIRVEFRALQSIKGKTPVFRIIEVLPPGKEEELVIDRVIYDDGSTQQGLTSRSDILNHIKLYLNDEFLFELNYKNILGDVFLNRGTFEGSIPGNWIFIREKTEAMKPEPPKIEREISLYGKDEAR